jgi:hypothetical protein
MKHDYKIKVKGNETFKLKIHPMMEVASPS